MSGKRVPIALAALAASAILLLSAPAEGAGGRTHLFRGLNAPGLKAADSQYLSGGNPDLTGAIGRTDYLEFVKARMGLFDTSTLAPVGALDPYKLFNHNPVQSLLVDPQVVWDDQARRWYAAEITNVTSSNELLVAWSRRPIRASPTGGARWRSRRGRSMTSRCSGSAAITS
jgi:hypothetical protein